MNDQAQALIDDLKAKLPVEAAPVVDAGVKVLAGWLQDGQLQAWIDLMHEDPTEAERQLAEAMSDDDLGAALDALANEFDAAVHENAAAALRRKEFWKAAVNGLMTVAGAILLPLA